MNNTQNREERILSAKNKMFQFPKSHMELVQSSDFGRPELHRRVFAPPKTHKGALYLLRDVMLPTVSIGYQDGILKVKCLHAYAALIEAIATEAPIESYAKHEWADHRLYTPFCADLTARLEDMGSGFHEKRDFYSAQKPDVWLPNSGGEYEVSISFTPGFINYMNLTASDTFIGLSIAGFVRIDEKDDPCERAQSLFWGWGSDRTLAFRSPHLKGITRALQGIREMQLLEVEEQLEEQNS